MPIVLNKIYLVKSGFIKLKRRVDRHGYVTNYQPTDASSESDFFLSESSLTSPRFVQGLLFVLHHPIGFDVTAHTRTHPSLAFDGLLIKLLRINTSSTSSPWFVHGPKPETLVCSCLWFVGLPRSATGSDRCVKTVLKRFRRISPIFSWAKGDCPF